MQADQIVSCAQLSSLNYFFFYKNIFYKNIEAEIYEYFKNKPEIFKRT